MEEQSDCCLEVCLVLLALNENPNRIVVFQRPNLNPMKAPTISLRLVDEVVLYEFFNPDKNTTAEKLKTEVNCDIIE
uniref:Uncharacterized protein n=1 Tax=Angiostrongylus cantonensis TaxID=6313 RepID=A0A0K0DCF1_ANGCA